MRHKEVAAGQLRTYVLVFDTSDEVVAGIRRFAERQAITGASFTGIGAFQEATLAYFDIEATEYRDIPIDEQVEVLTLAGDIALADDGPMVHAHVVVGRPDGTTRGGHLKRAVVRPTLEVVLTEQPTTLRRRHDAATGLALIDI